MSQSPRFSLDQENLKSVWRHFWTTFVATAVPILLAIDLSNINPQMLWVAVAAPSLAASLRSAWLYFSGETPKED